MPFVLALPIALAGHMYGNETLYVIRQPVALGQDRGISNCQVRAKLDSAAVACGPRLCTGNEHAHHLLLDPFAQAGETEDRDAEQPQRQELQRARQLLRHGRNGRLDDKDLISVPFRLVACRVGLGASQLALGAAHDDAGVVDRRVVGDKVTDNTALMG